MDLWLPQQALLDARQQYTARVESMVDDINAMREFDSLLKEIDPSLQLVKAKDDAQAQGLRPGYWHVIRHNPGVAPSIHVHEGPNGEFREPDSGLLQEMKGMDWWDDRVAKDRRAHTRRIERAYEKRREEERKRRNEEATDRLRALESPGVSMAGSFARQHKV